MRVRSLRTRAALQFEILALRHQVGVLQRSVKRPKLTAADRFLWAWPSSVWNGWESRVYIVQAATVIGWQRKGFGLFWSWKIRHGKPGRPPVPKEIRQLIRMVSRENPLWGAPHIHGELLKLGIDVGETSVSKYMVHRRQPPSQTWMREAFPWDAEPRYLLRDRDRIFGRDFDKQVQAMGIKQVLSAPRSPWQRPYVERLIGTVRRECLDHMIVYDERSLYRHLKIFMSIIISAVLTWVWRRTRRSPGRSKSRNVAASSHSRCWVVCTIATSGARPEHANIRRCL